jgi:putative Ca2+/H+ antiporter (TMEM165/GDT1 family)
MRTVLTVFAALFLAELGDKTQLAVIAFTSDTDSPWKVFLGASAALVLSTAVAVLFGRALLRVVPAEWLRTGAGVLFLVVGVIVLIEAVPELLNR